MSQTPGLSKHTAFGIQIQAQEGVEASDNVLWVPVNGTVSLRHRANREYPRQADHVDGRHLHFSAGQWAQGDVGFILVPDATVLPDLLEWMLDRDSYNQGALATVYKYSLTGAGAVYESFVDCKVQEATITLEKGRPVMLNLSVVGRKPGVATPAVSMTTVTGPFLWKESAVQVAYAGEVAASDNTFERAEIRVNNNVEDPGEGLRLTSSDDGGKYPAKIYNLAGIEVSGSCSRDFLNDSLTSAWVNQVDDDFGDTYDGQLIYTLARGAVSLILTVNRVQWGDPGPDYPGDNNSRLTQDLDFEALTESTETDPTQPLEYSIP